MLASPKPISACGWDVKPKPRSIKRAKLYCDTIIWQYKEMGAKDAFMKTCKDAPVIKSSRKKGDNMDEEDDLENDQEDDQEDDEEEVEGMQN